MVCADEFYAPLYHLAISVTICEARPSPFIFSILNTWKNAAGDARIQCLVAKRIEKVVTASAILVLAVQEWSIMLGTMKVNSASYSASLFHFCTASVGKVR